VAHHHGAARAPERQLHLLADGQPLPTEHAHRDAGDRQVDHVDVGGDAPHAPQGLAFGEAEPGTVGLRDAAPDPALDHVR
jgi:hypothetical protein